MKYLLDTNICIYIIKQRPPEVLKRFQDINSGDIAISTITLYELLYGAYKSSYPTKNKSAVRKLVLPLEILPFDEKEADICGKIRAEQEKKGEVIGPMDMQIAATALANDLTMVTHNIKEFKRISALKVETWIPSAH